MHNPQPSPKDLSMGAVQRLDGSGLLYYYIGLRYSPCYIERYNVCFNLIKQLLNGSLRLNLTQHGETYQGKT